MMPTPVTPLETFRQYFHYHPWHFWGLLNSDDVPSEGACDDAVTQYAWQGSDAAGRADILEALQTAEDKLRQALGYSIAPRYAEETLAWPRLSTPSLWRASPIDARGERLSVTLSEGYIQRLGVETLTLIGPAAITLSDPDGDGISELFTCSIATTVTDESQIAIYVNAANRLDGDPAGEAYRIQPVKVSISAGIATIKGPAWLLVKPILYEGTATEMLDPTVAANFQASVDVYRRWTNPDGTTNETAQALLTWETLPCANCYGCNNCSAGDSSNDPAAIATAIARVGIRDATHGIVLPGQATYNSATGTWLSNSCAACHPPSRVTVRYLAGYPTRTTSPYQGQMDPQWIPIVCRLAAAELARPISACEAVNQALYHWQFDVSRSAGVNDEQYSIGQADLENPFGTRRGQVEAWKRIQRLMHERGFTL